MFNLSQPLDEDSEDSDDDGDDVLMMLSLIKMNAGEDDNREIEMMMKLVVDDSESDDTGHSDHYQHRYSYIHFNTESSKHVTGLSVCD